MPNSRSPSSSGPRTRAAGGPVFRFRIRVSDGETIAVGPGKVALLEAIDATGSIAEAAKSLGMSYRKAWLLLGEMNRSLAHPAIDSAKGGQRGGGSLLTPEGRRLVELYRQIEATAEAACSDAIKQLMAMVRG